MIQSISDYKPYGLIMEVPGEEKNLILLVFGLSRSVPVAHWSAFHFYTTNVITTKEKVKYKIYIPTARNVIKDLKRIYSYMFYYSYYNLI
jgi:hypothetical protein